MVQHNRQSLYSTSMLSSGWEIAVQHLLQWTVCFRSKSNDLKKKKKDLILEYGSWTAWETQILIGWKCQWEPYSETSYKNRIPTKDYKAKEQKSGEKKKSECHCFWYFLLNIFSGPKQWVQQLFVFVILVVIFWLVGWKCLKPLAPISWTNNFWCSQSAWSLLIKVYHQFCLIICSTRKCGCWFGLILKCLVCKHETIPESTVWLWIIQYTEV